MTNSIAHSTARAARVAGVAILVLTTVSVHAADWSDTALGYRTGSNYREPFNPDKIRKNIVSLTHVRGYAAGTDFVNVDFLLSDNKDSPGKNANAREFYAVYRHNFDLGYYTGKSFAFGPVRAMGLTAGFDWNSKTRDSYQSKKQMWVAGPTLKFDVPGFLDMSLLALWESNAPAAHPSRYRYETHPMLNLAWGIPIGSLPLSFEGFANFIGSKGKDEFGSDTRAETNIDMQLMWDAGSAIGMAKNTFKLGLQYQYWKNKFGNDSTKDASGGATAKTPMIRAEYHF